MRPDDPCPFTPGSGQVPDVWAGRQVELADARIALERRRVGVYDRGRVVIGEYGIGKSVLLNRIASDAAAEGHWVADQVRLPLGGDPVAAVGEILLSLVRRRRMDARIGERAEGLLDRVAEVSLPVVGGGVRLRTPGAGDVGYRDVRRLAAHVARLALEDDRVLLLRIDEIQNADAVGLSQLLTVLGDLLEMTESVRDAAGTAHDRVLPVVVYLSGLPDFRARAGEAGATFARRFKPLELDYLEPVELRTALAPFTGPGWPTPGEEGPARVHMEDAAVDALVDGCQGDPFLFQLAGEAAWRSGAEPLITEAHVRTGWRLVSREVVGYVQGRLQDVTALQMEYLRAAALIPEDGRSADAVAKALGRDGAAALASTAQALDVTHRLIRREAGMIRFRSAAVRAWLAGGWP